MISALNFKIGGGGAAPTPAPVGATLMKTGQTTSYRTGDDGDLEAGREVSFTVLSSNNPFSNTNRFTDELGGQTYTNNIVIDWSTYDGSTVLGISRLAIATGQTWNNAVDNSLSYSVGTFTSGWRLINMKEIFQLADNETKQIIWMHLLTISALVDPAGRAREILKEESQKETCSISEVNFLTDIISKVESNVNPNSNPMEAVTSIMQSGIFSEFQKTSD